MFGAIRSNKILRFLVLAAGLYVCWLLCYYFIIKAYTNWDFWLNYSLVYAAQAIFGFFDVITEIVIESDHVLLFLNGGNYRGIWVGDECNGFKLFSIFSIFIIAFPGNVKSKLWFIPLGFVIIHLANIFRVMALVLINNYYPTYLDFNHLYTFTIFVYAIIFLLWYVWVKKYGARAEKN